MMRIKRFKNIFNIFLRGVVFLTGTAIVFFGASRLPFLFASPVESVLKIEAGVQPESILAPQNAQSLTFTVVELTAVGQKDITIKNMVVERRGPGDDGAFAQVSISGTPLIMDELSLNSKHRYETQKSFVVKAGATMELAIYGNMASDVSSYAGQRPALALVRVDASAPIQGTLPIAGAAHTINSKLTLGTIAVSRGARDPGSAQSFAAGRKDAVFTSVRADAGSAEAVKLTSATWTQLGSMGSADIENLKTYVVSNGTATSFDTVMDGGRKFWVATFGDGIILPRGGSAEVFIKGDIAGGANRTIEFDMDVISLEGEGQAYKYMVRNTDIIAGFIHTISKGSLLISGAAQNQYHGEAQLGEIYLDTRGEGAQVHSFDLQLTSLGIGRVKIYDSIGALVAGPTDPDASGRVRLVGAWTAPVGRSTFHVTGSSSGGFKNTFNLSAKGALSHQDITVTGLASP